MTTNETTAATKAKADAEYNEAVAKAEAVRVIAYAKAYVTHDKVYADRKAARVAARTKATK